MKKFDRLTARGEKVLDAARACGVPYFTITRWQKEAGRRPSAVPRYRKRRRKELLAKFDRLVACGMPVMEAAKECGVAYMTINRWKKATDGTLPSDAKSEKKAGEKKRG